MIHKVMKNYRNRLQQCIENVNENKLYIFYLKISLQFYKQMFDMLFLSTYKTWECLLTHLDKNLLNQFANLQEYFEGGY